MFRVFPVLLAIVIVSFHGVECENGNSIDYVIDYVRRNLSTYQVNIFLKSVDELSSSSAIIVRRVIDEFPAAVYDAKTWSSQGNGNRSLKNEDIVRMQVEEGFLKIGFVDSLNHSNETEELTNLLDFVEEFNPIVRGYYLIFLFNKGRNSLERFLRLAWSRGFLDLTIVEWIQSDGGKMLDSRADVEACKTLVHILDPFLNEYSMSDLTWGTNLFPNKLKNLNGYQLFTQFSGHLMHVMAHERYTGPDFWDMLFGFDVSVAKALAEAMNFSAIPRFVIGDRAGMFKRFNVTNTDHKVKSMDFRINLDHYSPNHFILGSNISIFKKSTFEQALFSTPLTNCLLIKQYGIPKTQLSPNLFIAIVTFIVIASIYFVTGRIFSFDRQKWTFNDIMEVLIHGPKRNHQKSKFRNKEKIILLSMCAASSILFVYMTHGQLNIFLYNEQFLSLRTLQDVADSKISIALSKSIKEELSLVPKTPVLQTIIDQSNTVSDGDGNYFVHCWSHFLYENNGSSYGCVVNSMLGKIMAEKYSDKKKGWILSLVEEPFQVAWPAMKMKFASPHKGTFEKLSRRFLETGLVNYWLREAERDAISFAKNLRPEDNNFLPEISTNPDESIDKSKISFHLTLACIFVSGCIFSCIVMIFEKYLSSLIRKRGLGETNTREDGVHSALFVLLAEMLEAQETDRPRFSYGSRGIHSLV